MYTVCVAGLLVVLTICYICIMHQRNNRNKQNHRSDQQNANQNDQNISLSIHENIARHESIYDEIDEEGFNNDIVLPVRIRTVSNESFSYSTTDNETENMLNEDDYLNPYQPIVSDSEKHEYEHLNVSCNNLNGIEDKVIIYKGNEEIPLGNVENMHHYPEMKDRGYEYPINRAITSSSTNASGLISQPHKKIEYAEIINDPNDDNSESSKLNLFLSNEKVVEKTSKPSYPIAIKRLTI